MRRGVFEGDSMREIKFRGRRKDNGAWVYGWYIAYNFGGTIDDPHIFHIIVQNFIDHCSLNDRCVDVDPATVGQYTGLKDKNGTEMYFDSDIVEYTFTQHNKPADISTVIGTVILDLKFTNSLCVRTKGGSLYHFTPSEIRNIEIIGNFFENGDLNDA
jgi:uncharacterized phage protein (TIGR01671 family)